MDERFKKINRLLSRYSLGQFDYRLELSPRLDEIDAFIAGVNMLGEDLKAITISRNYFTNIFNSVSDMVFILNKKGLIEHLNQAAIQQLEVKAEALQNVFIDQLQVPGRKPLFQEIVRELKKRKGKAVRIDRFQTTSGKTIPVRITAVYLQDEAKKRSGYLLTVQDITLQLETENLIIRAIIDTQEKEQKRLAQDLHDSLGQQLSAIKFFICSLTESLSDEHDQAILLKSAEVLSDVICEMRNICFNLMPKSLEDIGLQEAVKEMCNQVMDRQEISIRLHTIQHFPHLSKELQIDIYRVIQEFMNNALKHGNASRISIRFSFQKKILKVVLQENGKGFDPHLLHSKGMGLQNVQSRVKSHNGEISIISEPGKGTRFILEIPVSHQLWKQKI